MYPIHSPQTSRRIATLESESKAGIVPLRERYIHQDEQSHAQLRRYTFQNGGYTTRREKNGGGD